MLGAAHSSIETKIRTDTSSLQDNLKSTPVKSGLRYEK